MNLRWSLQYQGELPSSAVLPNQGRFIGEEWSTGNTSWIWMKPTIFFRMSGKFAGHAGEVNFASWVDP